MTRSEYCEPLYPNVALRPPEEVMRLARMGAFFPTRLSFMRTLIRRLAEDGARVTRPIWEMTEEGFGRAVYLVRMGGYSYSLVALSTPLKPERRTDRVIAEAWDTSYVLYDGIPASVDLDRLQANSPKQEAGRFEASDLVLSRANKSLRLFEHVVNCLSCGRQPDKDMIGSIGYLMRTTAVYANGKFGTADRARIADRPGLSGPFQAEMLIVWMIRGFTHDLVEHVAHCRSPGTFVPLERELKRHLGIGNATGLGMAPFLVSHPVLINNWMVARETALARVRAVREADVANIRCVRQLMTRVRSHLNQWNVGDTRQMRRIEVLRREFAEVDVLATPEWLAEPYPWHRLVHLSSRWSLECQELIVALLLEPHGQLVDGLADYMASDVVPRLQPSMTVGLLRKLVRENFIWALDIDFTAEEALRQFWYVSEDKLEPRLGLRYSESGAELELPLDIARQVQSLDRDLANISVKQTVAEFLMEHPEHRYVARRIQTIPRYPYAEIRDNLIGEDCLPIDMLRCKLSFFGASKFDPKSDRWTRITLYQGAPLFDEIATVGADDWWLPVL